MKNVLILAAGGMAGHVISKTLSNNSNLNILNTIRTNSSDDKYLNLDLMNTDRLKKIIEQHKPDYIINCAGMLVADSKNKPLEAIFINSYLPNFLDSLSENHNFKLIHISTDCVFSGHRGQYTEQDSSDALDTYGRTKALGELINPRHLIIRTSIIGPELKSNGTGLLHWFLNQSGIIKGFDRAIWSGVTTVELAKFIAKVIEFEAKNELTDIVTQKPASGIYHLTNNHSINKYNLLELIRNQFNITHIHIEPDSNYCVNKSFINTRENLNHLIDYKVPSYLKMIDELYNFMLNNKFLYSQYQLFD